MTSNPTTTAEGTIPDGFEPDDFAELASLMQTNADNDRGLRAVMSNNFNLILAALARASRPVVDAGLRETQIKHMVNRFLGWKLPEQFHPDAGISFEPEYNVEYNAKRGLPPARHDPSGTNLFDAMQAEAMVRYMLDGLPLSALPEAKGAGVGVKPLEWRADHASNGTEVATCALGEYVVEKHGRTWATYLNRDLSAEHDTVDRCKAAAQADYEQRILSAISPEPVNATGGEPELWQIRPPQDPGLTWRPDWQTCLTKELADDLATRGWDVRPLYASPQPVEPGMVLVPREPTTDMKYVGAGVDRRTGAVGGYAHMAKAADIYRAMLAAAPQQPGGGRAEATGENVYFNEPEASEGGEK